MNNGEKHTYLIPSNAADFEELMIDIVAERTLWGTQYKMAEVSKTENIRNPKIPKIDIQLLRKLENDGKAINTLIFARYLELMGFELIIQKKSETTKAKK